MEVIEVADKASTDVATHAGSASPLARFAAMAESIPEVGNEGMDSLIMSVLSAQTPTDLSKGWDSDSTEALVGKTITITSLKRAVSEFNDGLGVFLVVDYFEPATGEPGVFTTGSQSVVLQLVKAHSAGWLPLDCVVTKAKRPTKDGYYPLHLEVLGVSFGS